MNIQIFFGLSKSTKLKKIIKIKKENNLKMKQKKKSYVMNKINFYDYLNESIQVIEELISNKTEARGIIQKGIDSNKSNN